MKWIRILTAGLLLAMLLCSCATQASCDLAATTLPVYTFTRYLCSGTPLQVAQVVTENVSCLHDYTLKVDQMKLLQQADAVVISGAGLEDFMEDALDGTTQVVDAASGISLLEMQNDCLDHADHDHHHAHDPHLWLSPDHASAMANNICTQLCGLYPQHKEIFTANLALLQDKLQALKAYGQTKLQSLSCRELITFHDGFSYFAQAFDLTICKAVEEESGSEASAKELIALTQLVTEHHIPAIFTETNGSVSAAHIIAAETGVSTYTLDMCMGECDYFEAMYRNIDTIWEALQ